MQEVCTRAFAHLDSLRNDAALKPWIAQLTRRASIDRLRARSAGVALLPDAENLPHEAIPDFEQIERAMTVQRALDELPAPYDEVLGASSSTTRATARSARRWAFQLGTVASRISRGLSMLRAVRKPRCLSTCFCLLLAPGFGVRGPPGRSR